MPWRFVRGRASVRPSPPVVVLAAVLTVVAGALLLAVPSSAPFVIAFVVAVGASAWQVVRSPRDLSGELTVRAILLLACGGAVMAPAAIGAVRMGGLAIEQLVGSNSVGLWSALVIGAVVVVVALGIARWWPARLHDGLFLIAVGTLFVVAKLFYVHLVEVSPPSDFGRMWAMAGNLADGGGEVPVPPRLNARIYFERIIPYLLPLRALFGPENSSYEVPNVLVGLAASGITYGLARTWFGRAAGRIAFVLANVAVETWLASAIPTHDIPGAFLTLTALGLFVRLDDSLARRRLVRVGVASFALGLVLLLVDLQRTTGWLVWLPCATLLVVGALVHGTRDRSRSWRWAAGVAVVAVAVPALLLFFGRHLLARADLTVPEEAMGRQVALVTAAHTDSWGSGRYSHYRNEWALVYGPAGLVDRELVLRKVLSDLRYSPFERVPHAARKGMQLYSLGSQHGFYLREATVSGRPISPRASRSFTVVNQVFVAVFLGFFVVGAWRAWGIRPPPLIALLPIAYLAALSAALIGFGEVQPRYLYQVWYVAPIYIGPLLAGTSASRRE